MKQPPVLVHHLMFAVPGWHNYDVTHLVSKYLWLGAIITDKDRITGNIVSWFINDSKLPEQTRSSFVAYTWLSCDKLACCHLIVYLCAFGSLNSLFKNCMSSHLKKISGIKRHYSVDLCNTNKSPEGGRSLSGHNVDAVFDLTVKSHEFDLDPAQYCRNSSAFTSIVLRLYYLRFKWNNLLKLVLFHIQLYGCNPSGFPWSVSAAAINKQQQQHLLHKSSVFCHGIKRCSQQKSHVFEGPRHPRDGWVKMREDVPGVQTVPRVLDRTVRQLDTCTLTPGCCCGLFSLTNMRWKRDLYGWSGAYLSEH